MGPCVLTCRYHDGGTGDQYFHLPCSPNHNIPALRSDQLAHAVMKPRTIRPMRSSAYSNTYQMHEMRGSFGGIDTCDVSDFGSFNFLLRLTEENESLILAGHLDCRALLWQLVAMGKINRENAATIERRSLTMYPDLGLWNKCIWEQHTCPSLMQ